MRLVELDYTQFDAYAKMHPLSSYCQSSKYALVMSDMGYSYDYIAMVDDNNTIQAATLILTKKIKGSTKYGYAPKGFLINYYNKDVLKEFLDLLTDHYKRQDFIFIKFNPEIITGETDLQRKFVMNYNGNVRIIDDLKAYNVKRRLELKEFDLMMPKYNAYIPLKDYNLSSMTGPFRKKVKKCINRGMSITIGGPKDIKMLYEFCKGKTNKPLSYFQNLYNVFNKDNSIDLVLAKMNFQKALNYTRNLYDDQVTTNEALNRLLQMLPGERRLITKKMQSDQKLENLKKKIIEYTEKLKRNPEVIIAAALVIKTRKRITIAESGFSSEYSKENPNHFLHYAIFDRYKEYFNYCDIGGVTGKFDDDSKYKGLNDFKAKWNSRIYEYIGEFDLICNERSFRRLIKTSFIEDEFSNHME